MKSVFFSAVALMGILLSSCNKEIPAPTPVPANVKKKLVKEAFSGYYNDTVYYEYDAQDRLTKIISPEDTYTFSYNQGNITFKDFRPVENRLVFNGTILLDNGKRATKLNGSAEYVVNQSYTTNIDFKYGPGGNLLERTDTRTNGQVIKKVFTWTNADITRIDYVINGVLKYYVVFDYSDLVDLVGIDHNKFECAVTDLTGNNSKHLPKKSTSYYTDNTPPFIVDYMYTLDSQGYPVKLEVKNSFGDVSKAIYTYNK